MPDATVSRGTSRSHCACARSSTRFIATDPNYFGNLKDVDFGQQLEIVQDTVFEEITCLGFHPDTDVLEATVQVKRSGGYGGDLCSPGSTEWVRFYPLLRRRSHLAGRGPRLLQRPRHPGLGRLPQGQDQAPRLHRRVPADRHSSGNAAHARSSHWARAILSWQVQPPANQPGWNPIWGNRLDRHIQLRPSRRDLPRRLRGPRDRPREDSSLVRHRPPPSDPRAGPGALLAGPGRQGGREPGKVPPHRFAAPLLASAQHGWLPRPVGPAVPGHGVRRAQHRPGPRSLARSTTTRATPPTSSSAAWDWTTTATCW